MSGDWIKMRSNLWDDPRVARLCDLTDASESAVIGGLYWLWASADQHSEDGTMLGLTLRSIDRKTQISGFGAALVSIGWLDDDADGVRIVRFDRFGDPLFLFWSPPNRPPESIWKKIRERIFKRDNYTCAYCGERGKKLECDHVIPVSRGGCHEDHNLVTACFKCNRSKRDKLVSEWRRANG